MNGSLIWIGWALIYKQSQYHLINITIGREPGVGRDVSKLINDNLASAIGEKPDRFVGLGTVPLQNTEMAITELDRCVNELGFKGIEINSQISGEELSTPRLAPFWAKVEELDILVFIHTAGFTHADRLKDHYFYKPYRPSN